MEHLEQLSVQSFLMWTSMPVDAKAYQICVVAGPTGHFVSGVMHRLRNYKK